MSGMDSSWDKWWCQHFTTLSCISCAFMSLGMYVPAPQSMENHMTNMYTCVAFSERNNKRKNS